MSIAINAKTKRAFADGAALRRAGGSVSSVIGAFDTIDEKAALILGFDTQRQQPKDRVDSSFLLNLIKSRVDGPKGNPDATKGNVMRTEEQLNEERAKYQPAYDTYAEAEKAAGREPIAFDEAFNAHLEALDAEGEGTGEDVQDVAIATATGNAAPAPAPAKPKGGKKAEPKPKPVKVAAPKAKAFRPTSDDRKALNDAAGAALKAAKVEGTARMKPADGTYSDFLSGKVLKLDEKGNGATTLNVVTASAPDVIVGKVDVTVKGGTMTAKGKKA